MFKCVNVQYRKKSMIAFIICASAMSGKGPFSKFSYCFPTSDCKPCIACVYDDVVWL